MSRTLTSCLLALASWSLLAGAQSSFCPNEVAIYNENLRTQTTNGTWFIVPVKSTAVQTALNGVYGTGNVQLAQVPVGDTSLFPKGLETGLHPLLVSAGYSDDIRMSVLQIDGALLNGNLYAPYVKRKGSEAILSAPISSYASGPDGNQLASLVPNLVSTVVEGFKLRPGVFVPASAAYAEGGGILSNQVKWAIAPNKLTGPGVTPEAYDFAYQSAQSFAKYTPKLFKAMLNQPAILSGVAGAIIGCQRNQYYFNNATSTMTPRAGNVTLGPAADGSVLTLKTLQGASPGGFYAGVEGFSACGQNVGYNPENCDDAAKNVDKSAL